MRWNIVQNATERSQRTRLNTALKQYHRMRTAHRRKRYARQQMTANVAVVMLYAIIFNFFADPGAVK